MSAEWEKYRPLTNEVYGMAQLNHRKDGRMILNRKIELEVREINEMEAVLNEVAVETKLKLVKWVTKKLQEAFDFGYSEGRKTNE